MAFATFRIALRTFFFFLRRGFRVDVGEHEVDPALHTDLERRVMTRWRWFTRDEITAWPEAIYPTDLLALLQRTEPSHAR